MPVKNRNGILLYLAMRRIRGQPQFLVSDHMPILQEPRLVFYFNFLHIYIMLFLYFLIICWRNALEKVLLFIIIGLSLNSCTSQVLEMNVNCDVPVEKVFENTIEMLEKQDFEIRRYDPENGYLFAVYVIPAKWYDKSLIQIEERNPERNEWEFRYKDGKIVAIACEIRFNYGIGGGIDRRYEYYMDDDADGREEFMNGEPPEEVENYWYWSVREIIAGMCKSKVVFTTRPRI